ncbi:hypothetical protein GINT2_001176 [Glugoides intestinalis]
MFELPVSFEINKDKLKKNYYSLSMKNHPDLVKNSKIEPQFINNAYEILRDDFLRAKLFTVPSETLDQSFLEYCIELEDKIRQGNDLSNLLKRKINECKAHYTDPIAICKWGYYQRLLDINNKVPKT